MLAGREGTIKVPVTSLLITHPHGRVVFDTGLHPATQHDPTAHVGELLASFHEFDFHPGEDITARLEAADVDPRSVTHVVSTCTSTTAVATPNSRTRPSSADAASGTPPSAAVSGYIATDFDTGQSLQFIDDEHDLFGDGTVVSFPTAGHTPGHQSLRVHTEHGGEFVLCGDACYLQHSLDHLALPGVVADRDAALLTLHLFRRFRDEGATLMFGHDPDVWASVPQAPVRLG